MRDGAPGGRLGGDDEVGRQDESARGGRRGGQHLGGLGDLGGLSALGQADAAPLGGDERIGHGAADEDAVGELEHLADDADLVGDLEPAEHDHERPCRVAQQAPEDLQLARHEQAGHGGQVVRDALRGRVRPVGRAEGVVDVHLREAGELPGEHGVVAGLLGVEAQVLEQQHLAGLERRGRLLGLGADAVVHGGHGAAEQLGEALGHRPHAKLRRRPGPWGGPGARRARPSSPGRGAPGWSAARRGCACRRPRARP